MRISPKPMSSGVIRRHLILVAFPVRSPRVPTANSGVPVDRGEVQHIVDLAREISGLAFGVYVGDLSAGDASLRDRLLDATDPDARVLVGIDPEGQLIAIVTGAYAQSRVNDQACRNAVLAIQSSASVGDVTGGLRAGLMLLAEHARDPHTEHLGEPA